MTPQNIPIPGYPFRKPSHATPPTGRAIAIVASGGTFLCSDDDVVKAPLYFKDFLDFVVSNGLTAECQKRGLHKGENGRFFFADGTEILYYPLFPSIDSTNATFQDRLRILNTVENIKCRERSHEATHTGVILIHGTDTGANTAGFLDLVYGRDMTNTIVIVSSQKPANASKSDGPIMFSTALDVLRRDFEASYRDRFAQVLVASHNGQIIFNANVRKRSDSSQEIYDGKAVTATVDLGEIRVPPHIPRRDTRIENSTPCVLPAMEDYDSIHIKHYEPTASGNQARQARTVAREIAHSLTEPDGYTGLTVKMAGSNNIPEYSAEVLEATDGIIPVFATSDVPGAETEDSSGAIYAAAGVALARRLGLNNLIVLPATRMGPDMRPEVIMAYAAKYARPRTPEFLLLCHLLSALAWTPEDNEHTSTITGHREDLVAVIRSLEAIKACLPVPLSGAAQDKSDPARKILADLSVRSALKKHIPSFVDEEGRYFRNARNILTLPVPVADTTAAEPSERIIEIRRRT